MATVARSWAAARAATTRRSRVAGAAAPDIRGFAYAADLMQIVVLGMHRSGTSMLTGLLKAMGCWLGTPAELTPVRADNPRGDLERRDVLQLDEDLLRNQGATWWRVLRFDVDALAARTRAVAAQRARDIVRSLDGHGPWAIKDPRLCLTLPIWRTALRAPLCVLVHRRPGQVAQSLQARDGLDLAAGIALWEFHTLAALRHSGGLPRLLIAHEQLVARPFAATAALHEQLVAHGASGLRPPSAPQIAGWVDPGLHRARMTERDEDALLNDAQRALRDALTDGSAITAERAPRALSAGARARLEALEISTSFGGPSAAAAAT